MHRHKTYLTITIELYSNILIPVKVFANFSFFFILDKLRYFFENHVKMFLYIETETSKFIKNKALAF